jgi:DNA topoisomerase-2
MGVRNSPDFEEDSTDEYVKPANKKAAIDDFTGSSKPTASRNAPDTAMRKASGSTTARKPSGSIAAAMKKKSPKKKPDSDDEMVYSDSPPARITALKRSARAAPKKYIEILSDDDSADKDESMFDDD